MRRSRKARAIAISRRQESIQFLDLLFIATLIMLAVAFISPAYGEDASSQSSEVTEDFKDDTMPDPLEKFNRKMYKLNLTIDKTLLRPVSKTYRFVVPRWGRERVSSAVENFATPISMINHFLQGKGTKALSSFWRFTINSTLGLAGLFDVASGFGLKNEPQDFGQTLGTKGAYSGAYLMLPLIGPSSVRDFTGFIVDTAMNPFTYLLKQEALLTKYGVEVLDKKTTKADLIDNIEKNSMDPYVKIRSLYSQNRAYLMHNEGNSTK